MFKYNWSFFKNALIMVPAGLVLFIGANIWVGLVESEFWIGVGVVVLFALIMAGLVWFVKSGKKKDTANKS